MSITVSGESFSDIIFNRTPLYILNRDTEIEKVTTTKNNLKYFESKDLYQKENNMVMLYELLPHQPFIFDRDGRLNSIYHWNDWVEKENYLGQFIYCTKHILDIVHQIIENDPTCIIVLQSDHSARYLKDIDGNLLISPQDRMHCLNAVYYLGKNFEQIKGQSGVNTWRILCNELFTLEMPLLEVPEYED